MKMKRTICMLLALCLIVAAGCTADKSAQQAPEQKAEQTSKGESLGFLNLMLGDAYFEEWNDNNVILNVSWNKIKLAEADQKKFPELKKTFDKHNKTAEDDAKTVMDELMLAAEESSGDEYNPLYLSCERKIFVQRADFNLVSYLEEEYSYLGGIHADYKYTASSFDPKTGKELILTDVLKATDELPQILSEKLLTKYDYVEFGDNQPLETLEYYAPEEYQWTMDYQGITFWFSPYDIAPYMVGALSVKLYFDEYTELFNEKYTKSPSENYVVAVPLGQTIDFDLSLGDSKTDTLYLYEAADSYGDYNMLSVTVNENTDMDEENYANDFDVYLAYVGGKSYLYSDASSDNDYHMFATWDLNKKIPVQTSVLYGTELDYEYIEEGKEEGYVYKAVLNNPDSFKLETHFEILGTRGAVAAFKASKASGVPEMTDAAYTFNYGPSLETAIVLEAELLPKMTKTELGEGAMLTPYQTDGETYVDLKTEDNKTVRLYIDASSWPTLVNGIPEDECFTEILYAG